MILLLRIPSSIKYTSGGKSPTCSLCKMLFILASLACSDLIDLDFSGNVRSMYLKNVSVSGLISTPLTMISPTSIQGSSSKKLYLISVPSGSSGNATSGSPTICLECQPGCS